MAAVATAPGLAALAVVRVSGPRAVAIAASCFRGVPLGGVPSHTAHVGFLLDGERRVDQVVCTVFRAPASSTGEDVVEFTCHGGQLAPHLVLQALLRAGARPALPGEFTQRAFLNGKLDLAQAEAVADLIHAASTQAHRVSLSQLRGDYSRVLSALREEMLTVTALVELELDFSDEDVEFASRDEVARLLDRAATTLGELLASYQYGQLVRDGVRVVIAGRPNAGKSTLLNRLLGYDRAIVSPTPGTTRDHLEAEAEIGGFRFIFIDTAGLRDAADAIEAEGVRRAHLLIEQAEAVVYLYDAACGLGPAEQDAIGAMQAARPDRLVLVAASKTDLPHPPVPHGHLCLKAVQREDTGVQQLSDAVVQHVARQNRAETPFVVTNARHRHHLDRAAAAVSRARHALEAGYSGDLLAADLKAALHEIGSITGAITNETVLDQIFSRFCIGK